MSVISWPEQINMLSINPDAADRHDVARLAADLMDANARIAEMGEVAKAAESLMNAKGVSMECNTEFFRRWNRLSDALSRIEGGKGK